MDTSSELATQTRVSSQSEKHEIDWDAYASQYDLLATNNPAYRENIELLREMIPSFDLPSNPRILDIGAGTGNFICALAQDLEGASFVHLDFDEEMNEVAKKKYEHAGIEKVEVHCCPASEAAYLAESFDLIVCINALYAIHPREDVLKRVRSWLKPNATFFVIDFGRQYKSLDWGKYILGNVLRERGLVECVRFFVSVFETARQNRRGAQGQADGLYWTHSTSEFGRTLEGAGFDVRHLSTCYREYCDLAVCRIR